MLLPDDKKQKIHCRHDEDAFIRMDSAALAQYFSSLTQNGIAHRNEARKKLRLPRSKQAGADDLTVQSNLLMLDQLQKLMGANKP